VAVAVVLKQERQAATAEMVKHLEAVAVAAAEEKTQLLEVEPAALETVVKFGLLNIYKWRKK
jgi:hypothetical protein